MYFTYVLYSLRDDKFYIGFTKDLDNRLSQHNTGKVPATRNRLPLRLVYYEACLSEPKAIQRERYFKTGFGRRFLKGRVSIPDSREE